MVNVGKYTLHGSHEVLRSYVAEGTGLEKNKHVLLPGSLTARPRKLAKHQEEKIVFQASFFRGKLAVNLWGCRLFLLPIGSMYGIFSYMYLKNQPNVGKYTSPMDRYVHI